jgi:organic radical activating enzyme
MPNEIGVTQNPDGSSTIEYDDGSFEIAYSDGSGEWHDPNGTIQRWDSNGNPIEWKGSTLASDREIEFPINTPTACQLKWSHSTIFLPTNQTASCHRVHQNQIPDNFDFHNTPEKIVAREKMLAGEWPGKGCEYCKLIEDTSGTSDRMLHRKYAGLGPPPELDNDLTATHVTPRWLEVYFSNYCNLKCVYCGPHFSSSWESELKRAGIPVEDYSKLEHTDNLFKWFENNIQHLYNLIILGGEPFLQPQSDRLLDFLETRTCPDLTLTFFSNLTVDAKRLQRRFARMQALKDAGRVKDIHIVASLDCWGKQAEYIRYGLDLELFQQNFEHLLHNTTVKLNINMAWNALSTFTMPEFFAKFNEWNSVRRVYGSIMTTNDTFAVQGLTQSPRMFGDKLLDWGYDKIIDAIDTHGNPELEKFKQHLLGLADSIISTPPDKTAQLEFHKYLLELDSRRGTHYPDLFPELYQEIHK